MFSYTHEHKNYLEIIFKIALHGEAIILWFRYTVDAVWENG